MDKTVANTNQTRWWDPLSAIIILCLMVTAATRLVVTRWTESLSLTQTLVVLGVILGVLLGLSRFSGRTTTIIAFLYGLVLVPWQVGYVIQANLAFRDRMGIVARRISEMLWVISNQKPVNDNILFIALMCALFFFLSVHAAYAFTRHGSPWLAVLPAGLVVMVIHTYDPLLSVRSLYLLAYLLFALILIARATFIRNRQTWKENRTHMPPDVGFDWIRFTLAVVIVISLLAWTMPALAIANPTAATLWSSVTHPWDVFQDKMSNMFSSLQSSVGLVSDFYGDSFTLGRGSNLSADPIFTVSTMQREPAAARYYWRAYSYDQYNDGRWSSSLSLNTDAEPDEFAIDPPSFEARKVITFTMVPQLTISTLYAPGNVEWVSVPSQVYYGLDNERYMDVAAFQATPSVLAEDPYLVRTAISNVSVVELREAGTDYPDWIEQKYLNLPDTITARTRQLAQDLAVGNQNPYDIAVAITGYLRTFEYAQVIEQPPNNRELIDWWLFEYQRGFCQYYATAEVVLLRSLGIPARLAVGYAEGEFVPNVDAADVPDLERFGSMPGEYIVRHRDAHAWPEVYFPGYGWVEFEPTASQNPISRLVTPPGTNQTFQDPVLLLTPLSDGPEDRPELRDRDVETSEDATGIPVMTIVLYVVALGAAAGLGYLIIANRTKLQSSFAAFPIKMDRGLQRLGLRSPAFIRNWASWSSLSPVVRSYQEINYALRRLGETPSIQLTPAERGFALQRLAPDTEMHVRDLLNEYHRTAYSQSAVNAARAISAGQQVRKLSYQMLIKRFINRISSRFQR